MWRSLLVLAPTVASASSLQAYGGVGLVVGLDRDAGIGVQFEASGSWFTGAGRTGVALGPVVQHRWTTTSASTVLGGRVGLAHTSVYRDCTGFFPLVEGHLLAGARFERRGPAAVLGVTAGHALGTVEISGAMDDAERDLSLALSARFPFVPACEVILL